MWLEMIRKITLDDLDELQRLIVGEEIAYEFESFGYLNIDVQKAREIVAYWVTRDEPLMFVAVENGEIIGFLFGEVYSPWCATDKFAVENILYVRKAFRGAKTMIALSRAFEEKAKEYGCRELHTGLVLKNPNSETRLNVLNRSGYEASLYFMKKVL